MLKQWIVGRFAGPLLLLLAQVQSTSATPIVSVDLDPSTNGIQSALTVDLGTSFTIDLVVSGFGEDITLTRFETVYNDDRAGTLGLAGGTGLPTAGSLAAPPPVGPQPLTTYQGVFDTNSFASGPILPGSALALPTSAPFIPTPGFSSQSGAYGMLLLGGADLLGDFTLFSLTFDALIPGESTIAPSALAPDGDAGLLFFLTPVEFVAAGAKVTVLDSGSPIPEPPVLALFVIVLLASPCFANRGTASRTDV